MQKITWKLYSPLTADYFPQEVYDDPYRMDHEGPMELDGKSLTEYAGAICDAVEKCNARAGNLAVYIHDSETPSLAEKVISIEPSAVSEGDVLMGCATVKLREPLNEAETAALCEYLTGQYADGWGEGFEQREIEVSGGVLFVHFWNGDQFGIEIDRHPQAEPIPAPKKLTIDLTGEDGNIFAVIALVSQRLRESGQADRSKEMCGRVFASGSYNAALAIIGEYIDVEYIRPVQPNQPKKSKPKGDEAR